MSLLNIWTSKRISVDSYSWLPERFFFSKNTLDMLVLSPLTPLTPKGTLGQASFRREEVEGEKIISFGTNWICDEFEASKWRCWVGSWICESEIKMWHFGYRDGKWRLDLGWDNLGNKQRKENWNWRLTSPFQLANLFYLACVMFLKYLNKLL